MPHAPQGRHATARQTRHAAVVVAESVKKWLSEEQQLTAMGKGRGALNDAASAVDSALANTFGGLAKVIAKTPFPVVPACMLFAMIMGGNNLRMFGTLELRPSKMFCPPDSPAIPQSDIVRTAFDVSKRVQAFIVLDDNVLSKPSLLKAQGILDTLRTMKTEAVAPTFPAGQPAQTWDF